MSRTQAIAKDPVQFFRLDGVMVEIPIANIYFDDGVIGTSYPLDASSDKLPDYLTFLAKRGDLKPAPVPEVTLLRATAKPGGGGNRITITVAPSSDTTKVDITVTQTDVYDLLTLASLNAVLGDQMTPVATNNGLLRVRTNTAGAPDPVELDLTERDAGSTAAAPTWTISDTSPSASPVKLEPKDASTASGFGQATFRVVIPTVTPAAGGATFTLRVETTIKVTGIAFGGSTLPSAALDKFKYLVTFTAAGAAPAAGYPLPRASTTSLHGGADQTAPVPATATLLAAD